MVGVDLLTGLKTHGLQHGQNRRAGLPDKPGSAAGWDVALHSIKPANIKQVELAAAFRQSLRGRQIYIAEFASALSQQSRRQAGLTVDSLINRKFGAGVLCYGKEKTDRGKAFFVFQAIPYQGTKTDMANRFTVGGIRSFQGVHMTTQTAARWQVTYSIPDGTEKTLEMDGDNQPPTREVIGERIREIELHYAFGVADPSPHALQKPPAEEMQSDGFLIGRVARLDA